MGDLQVWPLQPIGVLSEDNPSLANPHPSTIGDDRWVRAENRTSEIIRKIQPTVVSEQRRKTVVDYVQRVIRGYLGIEVFPFGSVPLKTYLPDGDIDLTALSPFPNIEDGLANDVRSVLEGEEQNKAAEFEVKDVQYIHAEVKLVKCLVQNIVVDISFNQLGGLGTLCFLEQVDRLIGKVHLFKRSIILIKAWCYYESRILGAHHGLISTYALETLVLYVFHLFHSSLRGPLEVLYRFLDHFSKFDWDNYCVSLNGPVSVSSLPDIVAETPENDGVDLLLSKEFLKSCVDMFSVPSKGSESNTRSFPLKHLNIVDPLKENNNLGRSVSKGNFYRIRSAFTYGARKLGRILLLPEESIAEELNKFFMNTLDRHGSGQRPDVQDPVPTFLYVPSALNNGSGPMSSNSDHDEVTEYKTVPESPLIDYNNGSLLEEIHNIKVSELGKNSGNEIKSNGQFFNLQLSSGSEQRRCIKMDPTSTKLESNGHGLADANVVSGSRLAGDATDLASSRISVPRITKDTAQFSQPLIGLQGNSSFGRAHHAPHLYFSENGNAGNGNMDMPKMKNSRIHENEVVCHCQSSDEMALVMQPHSNGFCSNSNGESPFPLDLDNGFRVSSSGFYASAEDLHPSNQSLVTNDCSNFCESSSRGHVGFREMDLVSDPGSGEAFNSLSELSGDQESHWRSLHYGQWCHEVISYGSVLPYTPSMSYLSSKHSWEVLHSPLQLKRNAFPRMGANGVVPASPFPPASSYYHVNPPIISGAFAVEELPKPRGTGTYFPNLNHRSYKEKHSPGRGKNMATVTHTQLQRPRNNGRAMMAPDNFAEKITGHEPSQPQYPAFNGNGRGKPGPMEFIPSVRHPYPNSNRLPCERVEFGSLRLMPLGATALTSEQAQHPDSSAAYSQACVSVPPMQAIQKPGLGLNQERVAESYHLKDEDFPPLSV